MCPSCNSERPIDEMFCAACGADVASVDQELLETYKTRLSDARAMMERLELDQALHALTHLASQNHPKSEEIRATAQQLIP
ncbi:MAG: hypothetical protein ACOC7K_00395, partial [bacterium]